MLCDDLFAKGVVTIGVKVGCLLLGVLAILLFGLGIGLIASHHTQLALGSQIGSSGGALGLGGLMTLHFIIGGAIYGTTIHMQNNVTRAKCMAYFQSDDYAGLSLAWQTYFNESLSDDTAASALVELQANSFCCGLGPPANCIPNDNEFPTKFPGPPNVPQTVCVNSKSVSQYYPLTPFCYRNQACPYDHPIGSCGVTAVSPGSIGCAAVFHQYMTQPVMIIGGSVLVATFLLVLCLCTTLVLLWKRKNEDTLPPAGYGGWRASAKIYLASDVRKLDRLDI
ncbi:hypothetical protein SPRG_11912 [Saprolegnia parasitica CBS 223.65]|uniref:Tetraspanin n=1 Tax=Saprolegnia parasitica (strain CBS 223.65) TaxID=695850 RepID=A0A067C1Q3_SAPPC|nr:hypothetical protein SPRG_11912 [Saprolegnia parasitica CBS 223.65]KDO23065.1 hypothetical protein SPRG_11912 [Saprolegnia parasitica CBS 223.65]|eukprot:XP_012206181.1 hypothetical protein SPRG_11912 [Saprolegnia parasitica CBS 223.65]